MLRVDIARFVYGTITTEGLEGREPDRQPGPKVHMPSELASKPVAASPQELPPTIHDRPTIDPPDALWTSIRQGSPVNSAFLQRPLAPLARAISMSACWLTQDLPALVLQQLLPLLF